jgi:hypothetical protein
MCKKLIYLFCFVLALGLLLTNAANAADPNLVGWWKFDEGSGTTADDSSGNGNDGTLQGNPQWVAGKIGGALEFDGDDSVNVGNANMLNLGTDNWTITAWIKTTITGTGDSNKGTVFANGGDWSGGIRFTLAVSETGGEGTITLTTDDDSTKVQATSSATVNDGVWHHVVAMRDGTTLNVYIDGKLDGTNSVPAGYDLSGTSQHDVHVGAITDHTDSSLRKYFRDGVIDDVRIYNRALTEQEIQQVMIGIPPGVSSDPNPADKATDVPREVVLSWKPGEFAPPTNGHKLFLSESFSDVNDGIGGVIQDADSYAPPQRLDFGTTYYWRVDEVNDVNPDSPWIGDVWSFTTELLAYPIENIIATASSSGAAKGPENTVNSSGLDDSGLLHGKDADDNMWLSSITGPQPTWIEFQFDRVYKLHEMWVWNSNDSLESVLGLGIKDASIEYSVDGTDYTTLGTTHEFARAPGMPDYAHNTTVDVSGLAAKYVRLTANSNWGGILNQYGLSEVRFLQIPVHAKKPYPDSGTASVDVDVVLGWVAGREAVTHDVYFSTDEQAVIDGTAPVATVTETSYGPLSLDLGVTHYWKINEVNEAETLTTWESNIWSFTTTDHLVVDDFESYNDLNPEDTGSNRIFLTWIDGYGIATNGSIVGYDVPPFAEQTIVNSGNQSMPLAYNNTGGAAYSEAERTFATGQDWTKASAATFVLYFHGAEGNTGQLYVKVDGSKVVYDGDASDIAKVEWKQWNIDLASLGAGVQNVTKLAIGIDGNGATGTLYVDDIRLYRLAPQPEAP